MKASMYMRVGNREQLEPETDMEKKEQEFKNFCEKKKHQMTGGYTPQQGAQMDSYIEGLINKNMESRNNLAQHGRKNKGAR